MDTCFSECTTSITSKQNEILNFLLNVLFANESMLDTDVVNCATFGVRVVSIFSQHMLIKDVDQCVVYIAA